MAVEFIRVPFATDEIPFDPDDPIVFHVLTTQRPRELGERRLRQLMLENAHLAPPSLVCETSYGWSSSPECALIRPRDRAAGDDNFLFATPLRPFHYSVSVPHNYRRYPAVAYHQSTLARLRNPYLFRVMDLEWLYAQLTNMVTMDGYWEDDGDFDEVVGDAGWVDEDTYAASAVEEELRAIAECGTQQDPMLAQEILSLYGAIAAGRDVDLDDYFDLWPACNAHEYTMVDPDASEAIEHAWEHLVSRFSFYSKQEGIFHKEPPEVLIAEPLPLAQADWVRNADSVWVPREEFV